jgi:hypothetical protein
MLTQLNPEPCEKNTADKLRVPLASAPTYFNAKFISEDGIILHARSKISGESCQTRR